MERSRWSDLFEISNNGTRLPLAKSSIYIIGPLRWRHYCLMVTVVFNVILWPWSSRLPRVCTPWSRSIGSMSKLQNSAQHAFVLRWSHQPSFKAIVRTYLQQAQWIIQCLWASFIRVADRPHMNGSSLIRWPRSLRLLSWIIYDICRHQLPWAVAGGQGYMAMASKKRPFLTSTHDQDPRNQ